MNLPFSSVLHTNEGVFGEAIQGFTCLGLKDHFVSYRQDMFYQHSPLREKQVEELKEDELQVKKRQSEEHTSAQEAQVEQKQLAKLKQKEK